MQTIKLYEVATHCNVCGKDYTAQTFRALAPAAGGLNLWFEEAPGEPDGVEMRNCPCGGTMAVAVMRSGELVQWGDK